MDTSIPFLSALQSHMSWLGSRQKLVAENVANASTPGFKPKDLSPQDFASLMAGDSPQGSLGLTLTNSMHIAPSNMPVAGAQEITSPDSETTMDGNSVVLEEEMLKMSESRMQYEAAVGFYEKAQAMMRMAIKAPGK